MQQKLARIPNTGTTTCLKPLNVWCSRNATIATTHVIMYRRNVPKLLTSVITTRLCGMVAAKLWLKIPKLYQKLCGSALMVSSLRAAGPQKLKRIDRIATTTEMAASVQIVL